MKRASIDPVFRRNALLFGSGIFLLIAFINKPWILLSFLTPRGLTSTALLAIAGLFAAICIHEIAQIFLRGPGEPWFARRGALVFLPVIILSINALFEMTDKFVHDIAGIGPFLTSKAVLYEFIGMELLWIVLLEWPRRVTRRRRNKL